jgi:hypothetical protein
MVPKFGDSGVILAGKLPNYQCFIFIIILQGTGMARSDSEF